MFSTLEIELWLRNTFKDQCYFRIFFKIGTDPEISCAREVFSVLVERGRHDAVRRVERFLDAVAVVDVDIDVQHALK